MPYIDKALDRPGEEPIPAGAWVPELDRPGWKERHDGLTHDAWIRRENLTPDALTSLQLLPPNEKVKHLLALGADIGSVQRDGYLYANFLEQLKQAAPRSTTDPAADTAADDVVDRMKMMGLTSAHWDEEYGGPPKGRSPRPWRNVMDWLWRMLNKVGQFLADSIEVFMMLARDLILDARSQVTAISFSASIPPAIGFEICPEYFTDYKNWRIIKRFIDAILEQMGKLT